METQQGDLDLPMEHVQRPQPPWRSARSLTECGRALTDVAAVLTREQLVAKVKKLGQQRAAFTTCMVCMDKCRYNHDWDVDPVGCLMREAERYEHDSVARVYFAGRELTGPKEIARAAEAERFRNELLAIAALIEAHRDEFDEFCDGLASTGDLAKKRTARRAAQRYAKGSKR